LFWIGLVAPHPPWVLPDPYWTAYRYRDLPTPTQPPPEILQGLPLYLRQRYHDEFAFLTQEEITAGVRAYYGFVEFMDHAVGRVLDTLEEYGLVRDTIVIYTTDHGEMLGHNGMWLKDCLYEHAVRVPCIIRYPGAIPPGQVVPKCAEQIDLFPTLYDYLDIPPDGMEEGVSLRGLIANPDDPAWVDEAYAEDLTLYKMVRAGQWKYHRYPGDADHLHDLESDPGEVINLIDDPQYAEIKAYLLGRLAAKFGNPRSRYPLERA
jgi:arylsulfatase A-like enzyme